MKNKIALENFHALVEKEGLIKAVRQVFGNAVVKMPFIKTVYDRPIDELGLSTRSWNCLRRYGIVKIDQLLNELQRDTFSRMKNLGVKSFTEIKTKVLNYGYKNLSKTEQLNFLSEIIKDNCE